VNLVLKLGVTGNVSRKRRRMFCVHSQHQTFSRCGTGLKTLFHPVSELKIDMFNTSIGSCQRRRARNQVRAGLILLVFKFVEFIIFLSAAENE